MSEQIGLPLEPSKVRCRVERTDFDGDTYSSELDGPRLSRQLAAVLALMSDGEWRTLATITDAVGGSQAGISARLRDLRKPRYGARVVERRRDKFFPGLYRYRLVPEEVSGGG
jgi:hypothetical protein